MHKFFLSAVMLTISTFCFAQWSQVNTGITNLTAGAKLLGSSGTYLFSGTLGGQKMYRTNDNGNNWTEIQAPVVGNVPECGYSYGGKYFSGLNSSMDCVFYSSDNGTTWNSVTGGPQTTVVRGFQSLSGNLYAFTSNLGVFKSTDQGANWSASNTGLTNMNVIWIETFNTKIFAATIGAGVFISSDNGVTWLQSNTGIASGDLNATFVWHMGTNLYYYAQGGGSYYSSNEGATWDVWTKPAIMGLGINEVFRNGSNLYLESRHYSNGLFDSIYLSSDEGATWANITDNLIASDLNGSGITEFGGNAFIAYNLISPGLGIYSRKVVSGVNQPSLSIELDVYPNPFTDYIALSNHSNKHIKQISIYDIYGKLIVLGSNDISIPTSQLTDGVYVIHILFEDQTILSKKMVK